MKYLLIISLLSSSLLAKRADLFWIQSWGYQLQDVNLSQVEDAIYLDISS